METIEKQILKEFVKKHDVKIEGNYCPTAYNEWVLVEISKNKYEAVPIKTELPFQTFKTLIGYKNETKKMRKLYQNYEMEVKKQITTMASYLGKLISSKEAINSITEEA